MIDYKNASFLKFRPVSDSEFSGMGNVKFEFVATADVSKICRMISGRVL